MKNILQNMQCIIKKLHLTNKNLRRFSNVQMNEFPEGHVKVPSWELFILHIAKSSWSARGRLSGKLQQTTGVC